MQILEACIKTLTVFAVLNLGISASNRTKRQIVFENENRVVDSDCRTPDRRPGRCIRLTSCPALVRTVSRNRLRQYFCGYEGDEPRVCCPQPRSEVTTQRTTIRTTTRPTPGYVRTTQRPVRTTTRTTRNTVRFVDEGPRNVGGSSFDATSRPDTGTNPPFLPTSCGISNATSMRVIGGMEALIGSWPWMAVLFVRRSNGAMVPDCGGALVTDRHVVTAAHCIVTGRNSRPLDPARVSVRLGGHYVKLNNEPGAVNVNVEWIRRHEQFEARTYKNDIAVLKLSRPVEFTKTVFPVCLPYDSLRGENLTGRTVHVIGYGTTAFNGNSSDVLMQAGFDVISQDTCRRAYEPEVQFTRVYMCAGTMDGSKDACQGDSGGPLLAVGKNNNYYLVGIVSFGKQCGNPGYPGVYTRVTEFLDWLSRNLSD